MILATWICLGCGSLCESLSFVKDWTSACPHSIPHPSHSQIKKVFDFFLSMFSSRPGWQSLQVKKHLLSWFPFSNLAHSLQSLVPGMHTSIHPCSTPTPTGVEGDLTAQVKGQSILMARYLCQAISINHTKLSDLFYTAFRDILKISPALEWTHQVVLPVNEMASC